MRYGEEENSRPRVSLVIFLLIFILLCTYSSSLGSQSEGLYVDTSTSTRVIYDEANARGAADGYDAYIYGPISNTLDTWAFYFTNATDTSASFDSAYIYITHWASEYENDVLVLEYFDGTNWNIFETFNSSYPPPVARITSGPFSADSIKNWSQVNGFQVRLRGAQKVGGSDVITYYVDAIELRMFYDHSPVLDSIGAKTVDEGQELSFRVHAIDTDLDSIILTAESVPLNATFVDSGNGAGAFTFGPDYDQVGVYNVTFIASDGTLADSELVAITVNDVNRSPVLDSIGSKSVDEVQTLEFRVSAADPDGDALALSAEDVPTNATFVDSGNGAGSFTFGPDYDQSGVYNVTFIASDGTLADSELVAITVNNLNRSPVLDSIGSKSVDEAQALEFRVHATDPDLGAITLTAEDVPVNATFADSGNGAGSFTFNPTYDQAGVYNVTFIASDGSLADSELVAITVSDVNRSPVANAGSDQLYIEAGTLVTLDGSSSYDPDGDSIGYYWAQISGLTVILSDTNAVSPTFTPGIRGNYGFELQVDDGSLLSSPDTVLVSVDNQAPVLDSIGSKFVDEAQTLEFRISATDPDGDAQILSAEDVPTNATFVDSGNGVGSFTFDPTYDQAGSYNVTFIASDGILADSELVAITVNNVNRSPVLDSIGSKSVDEAQTLEFRVSASDLDGDALTLLAEDVPTNATFVDSSNGAGSFTFNPTYDQAGVYNVTLIASDGTLADSEVVIITVNQVNRSPVLDSIGVRSIDEAQTLEFRVSSSDPDGDALTLSAANVPTNAAFVDSGNGAGSFTFNPTYDQAGVYNVTFIASDGSLADSELVVITVNNVNRSPVLDSIGAKSVDEAQTLEFRVSAADPDGDALTLSAEDIPTNATFVDSGNGAGSFTFNPTYDQAGVYNVTFIASDGSLVDSELVVITVNDVNRVPIADAGSDQLNVDAGSLVTLDGSGSSDLDGDSLGYHWVQVSGLTVTLSDTNAVNPTFTPGIKGNYEFELMVDDGFLMSSPDTVLVSVANQAPVLDSIGGRSVDEGHALEFRVSATDADGDSIILSSEDVPANAAFVDSGNGAGSFTFNPTYDQAGVYNVTFIASDGSLADSELVVITVNNVNRSPVLDSIGAKSVDEAQTLEFRVSAADPDGDALILSAEDVPTNAAFVDSGNGAGSFIFNPDYDQAGGYNVRFIASDGTLADSELVAITVNDVNRSPVLDPIGSRVVDEGLTLSFRISSTDPDLDLIILTAESVPLNATFVDSGNGAGSFTFNTDYTQAGVYNVTFIASDGTLADSESVAITVNDVNRVPVLDSIGAKSVDEAQTLEFRISATDPDLDAVTLTAENIPTNAAFFDSGNGVGSFTFDPDYTQAGLYNVTFIASDGSLADSELVAITVNDVNRAPVADAGLDQLNVEAGLLVTLDGTGSSDPDGDSIGYHWVQISGLTITLSDTNAVNPTFTPDIKGNYEFELMVDDGFLMSSPDTVLVSVSNQAPVLDSIGTKSVDEAQTLEFRVSSTDADGDSIILSAEDVPTNATFVDSGNGAGSFTFNPDYDQAEVYNVTFIASDGTLADSELVAITVNDVNRVPVLDSVGAKSVDEAQTLEFRVSASDPDGDALTLSAEDVPTNAAFVDSGNGAGSFIFNPDYDQAGGYNVRFIASDGTLADSELVAITVNDVNRAPVADAGSDQLNVEAGLLVILDGSGSSDPDGDSMGYHWEQISGLTVTLSDTNAVNPSFTPDIKGNYEFELMVDDGSLVSLSDTVLVSVSDQAPVLDSIGSKSVDEGQTLEFRVSSTDADGDSIILSAEDVPVNATFVDSGNGAGSFTFNPDYDQFGIYNVTFIASDGTLADSDLVAITVNNVNRSPVLDSIGSKTVDEAQTLEFRVSSSDPDGDALILSAEDVPTTNATFFDSGNGAGLFTFDPDYAQAGLYNVTFIATDTVGAADSEVVAITVNNTNRDPVLASIGSKGVDEGQTLEFRISSSDPDLDSIILSAVDVPTTNATFFDSGNGAGLFTFDPDYAQAGLYNVTFIATDTVGAADSEVVAITVNNTNRDPVLASIGSKGVDEGQTLEFRISSSDPDLDSIILSAETVPLNATFVDSGNGAGSFTFNPTYDQAEVYNVTFIASDGALADSELVFITVNNVNRVPIADAGSDQLNVDAGSLVTLDGSGSSDPDGDSLGYHWVQVSGLTVTLSDTNAINPTFTPDIKGNYEFELKVDDGSLVSLPDTVLVSVANQAPVLDSIGGRSVDEGHALEFRVSATDADGDSIILSSEDVPANAAFVDSGNGAGSFTFNPTYDQAGVYNVTFIASDGTQADSESVAITVNDVNRSPVLDPIGSRVVDEGLTLSFRVSATDSDLDLIILTAETIPLNATFVDSGNGAGSFTFNPDYDQAGVYNVTFIATDTVGAVDSEVVAITVNGVNRSPVLASIGSKGVDEGQTLEFRISSSDPDLDSIILSAVDVPTTNATFFDSGNGASLFTFDPDYAQAGLYNVTFIATDTVGAADSEVVAITVNNTNRDPVLASIGSKGVDEGQTLEFRISSSDPDLDSIILSAETVPLNATFVDSGNGAGSFTFNPDYAQAGLYNVTFIATDTVGAADSEVVAITVNNTNRDPVLASIGSKGVDEGQTLEFRISSSDPDLDSIILSAETVPLNATFVDSGNGAGSFTFNPDYDQAGLYNVTFIATDTVGAADSEVVAITVNNTNRDPVLASIGSKGVDEGQTLEFRISSSDPDLDSIILSAVDVPTTNATFFDSGNGAGSFTFNPDYDQSEVYNVTFIASDGSLADSELVAITVNDVNRSPVLDSIGAKSVDEIQTLEFRVSASDPDGDALTLSAENVPTNATFVDSGNGAGSFTFDPDYTQAGLYNVTFIASDGTLADSELVAVTVNNVNRSPLVDAGSDQLNVDAGSLVTLDGSGSYDPDGDSIGYHWVQISGLSVVLSDTNAVNPTFTPSVKGNYEFELLVDDASLVSFPDTVLVSVANQAPVLDSIGGRSVDEGQALEFRVSATDADGDSIILSSEDVPANAAFVDSGNGAGSFSFNPDYNQAGIFNVTFIASDGLLADSELVAITVNDINRSPVLDSIGTKSVDEAQTLEYRASASDPDGDALTLSAEDVPTNATFVDSGNGAGSFSFSPTYDQAGVYNVTFIASDGSLADSELVAITVNDVNRSPVLDSIGAKSVDEAQALEFRVLATDPDGDALTLSAENVPTNAAFVDSGNGVGSFTFNPTYDQAGIYNVTFIASDGTLADSELVAITVNDVNRSPVLDSIKAKSVDEAQTLEFRVSSSDPDGDALTLSAEDIPTNGTFVDSGNGAGSFSFNPDYDQAGVYNVTFIVSDGYLADSELVAITVNNVNRSPVLDPIGSRVVDEGLTLSFRVSATDSDLDLIILTAETVPLNATFVDSGNGAGSFTFNPDYTQSGVYNVTFIAFDGTLADSELVAITVNDVNRSPVLDSIGAKSVDEIQTLEFRVSASDPDGDALALSAEDVPANATFVDSGNGAGSFTFNPTYDQAGVYNVTFIASDGSLADSEIVAITVNNMNRSPVLDSIGAKSVDEAQTLEFRVSATDPDGDALALSAENVPTNATFVDSGNGAGSFTFNPTYDQAGVYNVTFIASDGSLADSELVAITVNDVNRAPVADAGLDQLNVEAGTLVTLDGSGSSDPDGDSLGYHWNQILGPVVTLSDTNAVNPTFTPVVKGSYGFELQVDDGLLTSLPDTVLVSVSNQAPVLDSIGARSVDEGQTLEFRVSSSDPDGDAVTLSAEDVPTNATFVDSGNGAGSFTFNPDYDQAEVYNVTFIASDGTLADSELVAITVNDVNRVPVLDSVGAKSVDEAQTLEFRVSASDPDGDALTLSAEDVPANATFVDSGNGAGSFTFNPTYDQAEVYNVTFMASDGSLADSELVAITVNDVNRAPVLDSIGPQFVDEDSHLEVVVTSSDSDNDSLILTAEGLPANSAFTDSGNGHGLFVLDPDSTQSGVYPVRFIVGDGTLADSELVDVAVNQINLAPVLDSIGPQFVDEGSHLEVVVTSSDFDNDSLILTAEGLPANSAFTDSGNGHGLFVFDPDFTQSGVYPVRFIVGDGTLADSELVYVTVNQVNLAPVLDSIGPQFVDEGSHLEVVVTSSDFDNDSLILTAEGLPANSAFTDSGNGRGLFIFDPDSTQSGLYPVRFMVADGALADSELIDITVNQVNLAPQLDSIPTPQTVDENQLREFAVSATDFDGTIPILSAYNLPANASFTDHGDSTGTFSFTPDYFQAGSYTVLFEASDGELADSQYVDISVNNVNRPPTVVPVAPQTVDEGGYLTFTVNADDPDLETLTLVAQNLMPNATFVDSGNNVGLFEFYPDYTQAGFYIVRFIASDGQLLDTIHVDLTVNDVNRTPMADAGPDQVAAEAGFLVTLDGSGSSDPDGDSIGYHWVQISGLTVTLSDTNAVNPTFTPGIKGNYEFELLVDDASLVSLPDTVLVSVSNQAPVLDSIGAKSVDEGQTLEFRVSAADLDLDSVILTAENVPTNAAFIDSGNGAGSFTFSPDYTQANIFDVTFIASDGGLADSELVSITVNDINNAPVLDSIGSRSVDEGQVLEFRVSATDINGDSIILSASNVPTNASFTDSGNGSGSFSFSPDYTQSGIYNVTFIATDTVGAADSELVAITVNDINNAPVLDSIGSRSVDEGQVLEFRVSATDINADSIILSVTNVPTNASFTDSGNGSGSFSFVPDYTQSGIYNVTFIATDTVGAADSELVAITVNDINQAPVLDPIGSRSVDEGQVLEFRVSATDINGDSIILSATNVPSNASFTDSGNGSGSFSFGPDYTQSGIYNVTFIATDTVGAADSELVAITVNDINNAPVLDSIGSRSVDEGQVLEFRVSATDINADSIILSATNIPTNASFMDSGNGSGSFSFGPDYTQFGLYNVTFIATDTVGAADSELVAITVNGVNNAPVLDSIGSQSMDEGQVLSLRVHATDVNGDSLILSALDLPVNATFEDSGNGSGSFSFSPDYVQSGTYNVTFIATDTVGAADSELVSITVNDINNAPVLDSIGSQSVDEGQALSFRVHATDINGDSLILSAIFLPANASFTDSGNGSGSFSFSPDYTQSALYNVTFIATDSVGAADSEMVAITVNDVNQAPVADAGPDQVAAEAGFLVTLDGSGSSDPDGDSIGYHWVQISGLTVTLSDTNAVNPTFTPGIKGNYEFELLVDDASLVSLPDTVLVSVSNQAPVLDSIGAKSVDEGQTLEFRVSAADLDLDSVILTAENVPTNAAFIDSGNGAGSFTFSPDYTQANIFDVTFIASDGGLADSELVSITVNDINNAPVLDSIGSRSVDEGQVLEFRVSATDINGDSIILSASNVPTNASFTDSGNGSGSFSFSPDYTQSGIYNVTFIATDTVGAADSELVAITVNDINNAPVLDSIGSRSVDEGQVLEFRVSATDINADSIILSVTNVPTNASFTDSGNGSGSFSFVPDYTQSGIYNVTFIATDTVGAADSELVAITVNDINQAPVLDPIGSRSVDEGQTSGFRVSAADPDIDSIILSAENVPVNATFVDSGNGTGLFTFNPDYDQSGVYNVTFIASDGSLADSEAVAITVSDVNQAPVLDSIGSRSVDEDQGLAFRVSAADPDLDAITLTAENIPTNAAFFDSGNGAGSFAFNPTYDQAGAYNVTFIASDGSLADSEAVAITVNDVNRAPVADAGSNQLGAQGGNLVSLDGSGSYDPDGDSIGYHWVQISGLAVTLSDTNAVNPTFTPSVKGNYEFELLVDDASLVSLPDTVLVSVSNQAPVLDSIGAKSVDEGQTLSFRVSTADADGDSIILTVENEPLNATFVDSGNAAGSFTFNPTYEQAGVYNVTFIASDGSLADSELVTITVNDVNRSPVLDPVGSRVVDEGQTLGFRVSATDPDLDSIILTAETVPLNATFVDSGNGAGSFSFNPDYNQAGIFNVTFIASDGLLADSELVAITVNDINRSPVLDSIGSKSIDEEQTLEFRVSASDLDGDALTLTAEDVPTNATFMDSGNGAGSFSFSPTYDQAGVYNVSFIASDGSLADSELVAITANHINRSPELDSIGAKNIDEGQNLEFRVSASDPDGDALILSAEDVPTNATFVDSGNGAGSFTFNPDYSHAGLYNVTFIASDGTLADSEVVAVTVNDVNRSPVLDSIGSRFVDEGLTLSFRVHTTDPDLDSIILTAETVPLNATFVDSGNGAGSFSFNPDYDQTGIYSVTFIASDGLLADSELVNITVNETNRAPVTDAGSDQSGIEANTLVTLDGSGSYDLDGDSITYHWAQVGGPGASLSDSNAVQPTFTPTVKGTYIFQLIVSDGFLDSQPDSISVAVNNQPPIADAGSDQLGVKVNTLVTLDGSGSYDPDEDSLSYEWIQISGPSISLSDSAVVNPTFTPVLTGDYQYQLIVYDGLIFSQPDTVLINVPAPPKAVGDLMATISGDYVSLSWSAVTVDTSDKITSIERYVIYRGIKAYFAPSPADSIGYTNSLTLSFEDSDIGGADVVGDVDTNYYYAIKAVDVYGNYSGVSNRVGEYDYEIVVTPNTDFSYVTLPFTGTGITDADGLINSIGTSNINNVNRFIQSSQSYEARFSAGYGTNFSVIPGGVYQVNAKNSTIWSIAGGVPLAGSISYGISTTPTTDFNFISIPFENEDVYQTAQDVIDSLPGALNTLNNFIPSSQSWESRFAAGYGKNFEVKPGGVYQANAKTSATFPPEE